MLQIALMLSALLGFLPSSGLGAVGFHARYEIHRADGSHPYDAIVVWPATWGIPFTLSWSPRYDRLHARRLDAQQAPLALQNAKLAEQFVEAAYEFALRVYRNDGLITDQNEAIARAELAPVKEMGWPLIAIVPTSDDGPLDGPILHLFAFAPSDGSTLPLPALRRIYGPGGPLAHKPCPFTEHIRVPDVPVSEVMGKVTSQSTMTKPGGNPTFFSPGSLGQTHPQMSLVQNLIPRATGKFVEAKMFVSNPELPVHLTKTILSLGLTLGFHRFSSEALPEVLHKEFAAQTWRPDLEHSFTELARKNGYTGWHHYFYTLDFVWKTMAWQDPVQFEFVFAEVMGSNRINLFSAFYGLEPVLRFGGDQFGQGETGLYQMPLDHFETVPSAKLSQRPRYDRETGAALLPVLTGLARQPCAMHVLNSAQRYAHIVENQSLTMTHPERVPYQFLLQPSQ